MSMKVKLIANCKMLESLTLLLYTDTGSQCRVLRNRFLLWLISSCGANLMSEPDLAYLAWLLTLIGLDAVILRTNPIPYCDTACYCY